MKSKYAVVIEKGETSYGAYVPDLPGCVAVGDSVKEVQRLIEEAIVFHLEGMLLDDEPVPQATTEAYYVDIDMAKVREAVSRERKVTSTGNSARPKGKKR
jgi:predicted RNase H-like HicB family nuclease